MPRGYRFTVASFCPVEAGGRPVRPLYLTAHPWVTDSGETVPDTVLGAYLVEGG